MSDYAYLNTRVKAMSTMLLDREFFDQILRAEGVNILVDALLDTVYRQELSEQLKLDKSVSGVERALSRSSAREFGRIRGYAPEMPRRLLDIQFGRWDVANIVTIMRGRANQVTPLKIEAALIPSARAHESMSSLLSEGSDLQRLVSSVKGWDPGLATALREVIGAHGESADLRVLESALLSAYFAWAFSALQGDESDQELVRDLLDRQADLINIMVGLRGVREREAKLDPYFSEPVQGGRLSRDTVEQIRSCHTQEDALEIVGDTYFAPGIDKGILEFGRTRGLSKMERFLEEVVLETCCRAFRQDPLGIGVAIGYVWRKLNELINLRIVLRGKIYSTPANAIREVLLFV